MVGFTHIKEKGFLDFKKLLKSCNLLSRLKCVHITTAAKEDLTEIRNLCKWLKLWWDLVNCIHLKKSLSLKLGYLWRGFLLSLSSPSNMYSKLVLLPSSGFLPLGGNWKGGCLPVYLMQWAVCLLIFTWTVHQVLNLSSLLFSKRFSQPTGGLLDSITNIFGYVRTPLPF